MLLSALNWLLIITLVLGNTAIKPLGGFLFHLTVAALATIPVAFASKMLRIVGGVVLAVSLVLELARYPEYRAAEEYRRRSLEAATKEASTTELRQQEQKSMSGF